MTAPTIKLDTAEELARWLRADYPGLSPHTIRSWARRGHISRFPGDRYNGIQVADYLDGRAASDTRRAVKLAERHRLCVS